MEIDKYIEKVSQSYTERTKLRASVQIIPYVGGALDTLISQRAAEIQEERLSSFLSELCTRLSKLEHAKNIEPSGELYDFMCVSFEGVTRTRSREKHLYFASLIKNQVELCSPWEEAETANRLLVDLQEIHLRILKFSISLKEHGKPFVGRKVFSLTDRFPDEEHLDTIPKLAQAFPEYSNHVLQMACSELVAKFLLHDTGIGGLGLRSNEFYAPTDTARWFLKWISA